MRADPTGTLLCAWGAALAVLLGACALGSAPSIPTSPPVPFGPPASPQYRYTPHEANTLARRKCKGRSLDVIRCYLTLHRSEK